MGSQSKGEAWLPWERPTSSHYHHHHFHHYLAQESGAKAEGTEREVSADEAAEQALSRVDANGDGEVQPEEVASLVEDMGQLSKARVEELFSSEDKDGSGGLNKKEVMGASEKLGWWHHFWHHGFYRPYRPLWHHGFYHHYLPQETGSAEGAESEVSADVAAEQALSRVDANGDGEIQPEEVASLVEGMGQQSRARVEEFFSSEDKDGSG